MQKLIDPEFIEMQLIALRDWLFTEVLVISILGQIIFIVLAFLAAYLARKQFLRLITWVTQWRGADDWLAKAGDTLSPLALPLAWLVIQYISGHAAGFAEWPHHLITVTVSLLTAWIIIRLTTVLIRDKTWSKLITIAAWTVAALNILNLLDPTMAFLDSLGMTLGDLRISALLVIKSMISLAILLWLATLSSRLLEQRIKAMPNVNPSMQVLLTKILKIVLVIIAVAVGLSIVGIDLTAFAVFSGALGVGVGLGLQKSMSNLFTGMMILMDKSIKPGDVIEVGATYGTINSLGGRYVSVMTRDGVEHLIPNEEIITQRVANWTRSNSNVRIRLAIGVDYDTDLPEAIRIAVEAAESVERIITAQPPKCLVRGFGDSAIDLELRIWVNDPQNGVANISSEVYLEVWKRFKEAGIQMPFPQRDLHIKSAPAGLTSIPEFSAQPAE